MTYDREKLPLFVTVVSLLMVLVGLGAAYAQFSNPGGMMRASETATPAFEALMRSMAGRSFAMAVALLVALLLKSPRGLIAVLAMRALSEIFDLIGAVNRTDANVFAAIAIIGTMIICEIVAITLLWRGLIRTLDGPQTSASPTDA